MKRHVSYLVLAFVALFSLTLASCRSDDDPEPTLIGKWKVSNITMSNDFEFETGLHEGYTFMAINAGIDMSMDPYDVEFCSLLKQCVEEGLVPMERIDDAVSRVLRLKYRLGLFEHPTWKVGPKAYPLFGSEEFAADSRRAAEESMVLLKNEPATGSGTPVLPLLT